MSIPKSVQRQAEEADRLLEQLAAREDPHTDEPEVPDPPEPPTQQLKEQAAEPTPPPSARTEDEASLWKQRYDTLRGKYDAEVGRVVQENKSLQTQLQQLTAQVGELVKSKQPAPEQTPPQPLVTPQDAENYGSDMIDLIRRVAAETVSQREAKLEATIRELRDENAKLKESVVGVEQRQGQTAQEQFVEKLTRAVPDWEQINQNPEFLVWLGKVDPLTGQQRQTLLDAAASSLNAQRVAAFFLAFKESGRAAPSPAPTPQPQPPQPSRPAANPEVARQVQPGRSKASPSAPVADSATKIWSQREIQDFYRDVTQGRYTEDQRARTEAEIDLAVAEGRVAP